MTILGFLDEIVSKDPVTESPEKITDFSYLKQMNKNSSNLNAKINPLHLIRYLDLKQHIFRVIIIESFINLSQKRNPNQNINQNMSKSNQLSKQVPKAYQKRRFYNLSQLQGHCQANDIWVSFFGQIYDLTRLVQQNRQKKQIQAIISAAGTDISHWFDQKTKNPRKWINSDGQQKFYVPMGQLLHSDFEKDLMMIPWWKNQDYLIGKLTKQSQSIRIINTLSNTEDLLQVPRQQTINQILNRYEEINCHAKSYTWKRKDNRLNMQLTLEQNGILNQTAMYDQLEVPMEERYVPAIHIHFNDDLTSK